MTLAGRVGTHAGFCGTYETTGEEANGAPLYSKVAGAGKHFLYRSCIDGGMWMVTDDKGNIAKNVGAFSSCEAADLPSSPGTTWEYYDGTSDKWQKDAKMSCAEVRLSGRLRIHPAQALACASFAAAGRPSPVAAAPDGHSPHRRGRS